MFTTKHILSLLLTLVGYTSLEIDAPTYSGMTKCVRVGSLMKLLLKNIISSTNFLVQVHRIDIYKSKKMFRILKKRIPEHEKKLNPFL